MIELTTVDEKNATMPQIWVRSPLLHDCHVRWRSHDKQGMKNSSVHSAGVPHKVISPQASVQTPSSQQSLVQEASTHSVNKSAVQEKIASRKSELERIAVRQARDSNSSFPPRLLALAGKACLQEGPDQNLGCLKCSCSWSQQCYPKFLLPDAINVGICSTSVPVLCIASFGIWVILLITFIACRTLLQWWAFDQQDKEEDAQRTILSSASMQAVRTTSPDKKAGVSLQGMSSPAPVMQAGLRPPSETVPRSSSSSSIDPAHPAGSSSDETEVL